MLQINRPKLKINNASRQIFYSTFLARTYRASTYTVPKFCVHCRKYMCMHVYYCSTLSMQSESRCIESKVQAAKYVCPWYIYSIDPKLTSQHGTYGANIIALAHHARTGLQIPNWQIKPLGLASMQCLYCLFLSKYNYSLYTIPYEINVPSKIAQTMNSQ